MGLQLELTSKRDSRLLERMSTHYSHPKSFVARTLCYSIIYDGVYYGHIVSGSAFKNLKGVNEFFGNPNYNSLICNIFYNISKVDGKYPKRNFTSYVLKRWRLYTACDWQFRYGNKVVGFVALVEFPRTGELYLKDGWSVVGQTHGFTCKRIAGATTDWWGGMRIWDTKNLKPKLILCRKV